MDNTNRLASKRLEYNFLHNTHQWTHSWTESMDSILEWQQCSNPFEIVGHHLIECKAPNNVVKLSFFINKWRNTVSMSYGESSYFTETISKLINFIFHETGRSSTKCFYFGAYIWCTWGSVLTCGSREFSWHFLSSTIAWPRCSTCGSALVFGPWYALCTEISAVVSWFVICGWRSFLSSLTQGSRGEI